jgi:16S rRNA (guanine1207-N2)-methyltransferase
MSEHYFSKSPTSLQELGLIKTVLRGRSLEFVTSSGVFSHRRIDNGTRLLVETMKVPMKGRLLDLGCGYGVIGVTAALLFPELEVLMTDVNPRAIALAAENIVRNGASNARALTGSLYEPVDDSTFDVIVTNPPISAGMFKVVEPIIAGAPTHLNANGTLQLVVQSNKGGRTVAEMIKKNFGESHILSKKSGYRVFLAKKNEES